MQGQGPHHLAQRAVGLGGQEVVSARVGHLSRTPTATRRATKGTSSQQAVRTLARSWERAGNDCRSQALHTATGATLAGCHVSTLLCGARSTSAY